MPRSHTHASSWQHAGFRALTPFRNDNSSSTHPTGQGAAGPAVVVTETGTDPAGKGEPATGVNKYPDAALAAFGALSNFPIKKLRRPETAG